MHRQRVRLGLRRVRLLRMVLRLRLQAVHMRNGVRLRQ